VTSSSFERIEHDGVVLWTDPELRASDGICVAFSERRGGVSEPPFASLNLSDAVGDDPVSVDENRRRLLRACGLESSADRLVTAQQVHGDRVCLISEDDAGSGAAVRGGRAPVAETDALATLHERIPLLLLFADCVPIVLVALRPRRAVAVVHAGWRGAAAGLPGKAARALAQAASCDAGEIIAYVGPHIGPCHYEVGEEVVSHFADDSVTFSQAGLTSLDLGCAVGWSLEGAGVLSNNQFHLGICTAESLDSFYSYRCEGVPTGRHGALAHVGD
jgi:YfiH family protein